ncbi:hypothetical protein CLF_108462 [Clonorchis sinensis]|uniref:Uncharacterized protein n=1 Tax=Clonorchis sinensis TaxID=79923 RepID=G7YI37_CLOSI|nr:hypothetical protein CLF_108462 [Clonorchis sinensis]
MYGDESSFDQELAVRMRSNEEAKVILKKYPPVSPMDYPTGSADEEMEQLMDLIHREMYGNESSFDQELADPMRSSEETKVPQNADEELEHIQMSPKEQFSAMPPNEGMKNLTVTQQIRLYEQRCKTFGRAILEASRMNDFELAKLLLRKKKKLVEVVGLLRQGGCVKYVLRPSLLNANFKKPLLSEAELTDHLLTETELDIFKRLSFQNKYLFCSEFSRNIIIIVIDHTMPVFNVAIVNHTGRHNNWESRRLF